jgi:lipoate-protein ligase A
MNRNSITLSRRKTGGGAVYQDLGNTCFSFLTPYEKDNSYDYKTVNNKIMIKTF